MPKIFLSLRSRNLRLYFIGHGISLIGTWITTIASAWLVYRLNQSEIMLGFVMFCAQFSSALFAPIAGVYVDRWEKRRVLLWTQSFSMVQSFALAVLALGGWIAVWHIVVLNIVQGLINAVDTPARPSLLSELVHDRSDLPNAVALNSAVFHASRLIGPAIGGILVALIHEGGCFLLDGFSYGAVLLSLTMLRIERKKSEIKIDTHWFHSLREGLRYTWSSDRIRTVMILVAGISLFGTPQTVLLPVFTKEVFGASSTLYGYLAAATGFGAFCGALFLAAKGHGSQLIRIVAIAPIAQSIGLLLLGISTDPRLSMIALFVVGVAQVSCVAGASSIIQVAVEDAKRGRVMSLFSAIFFGFAPICGLIAGFLAQYIGAPYAAITHGLATLCVGIIIANHLKPFSRSQPLREAQ